MALWPAGTDSRMASLVKIDDIAVSTVTHAPLKPVMTQLQTASWHKAISCRLSQGKESLFL